MWPVVILLLAVLAAIVLLLLVKAQAPGVSKGAMLGEIVVGSVMILLVLLMLSVAVRTK